MILAKASYGKRVIAWLIDLLCISLLSAATVGLGIAMLFSDSLRPLGIVLLVVSPVAIIGFGLWNSVFRQGRTGQTIGKSVMSTKLVSTETGDFIGAGSAFIRGLVAWALNTVTGGIFFIVDLLFPIFDRNGQRVVDKMLKLQVTTAEARPTPPTIPQSTDSSSSRFS